MGLRLHDVSPRRGLAWIRSAFVLWLRRPLAFVGLFMFFLFGVLLLMMVPLIGAVVGLAMVPMLTLGFMIATRSALAGGAVQVLQIVEGLRVADIGRRKAQLVLCGLYALCSIAVIELAGWVDGGVFEKLQIAMATSDVPAAEINELLKDPRLASGMMVRAGLAALLSVPFWHAPALVHWGGQSAVQALFSSTLALWRARGAFALYAAGWTVIATALGLLAVFAVTLFGGRQWISLLAMPTGLILSAVFYVSLWFSFDDSFGDDGPAASVPPEETSTIV